MRSAPPRRGKAFVRNPGIAAVVLAGGFGTRISHLLGDLPKPLAPVNGRPFLEWVLRYLAGQGLREIALSTHHFAETVADFADRLSLPEVNLVCAPEAEPLGTAGGFLNAAASVTGPHDALLVCNGDSLALGPLDVLFSCLDDASLDGALLGVEVADASRYGGIRRSDHDLLSEFTEKRAGSGLINAGIYLFRRELIASFPAKRPLSFEFDLFPVLIASRRRIRVVAVSAPFLDIGTETSLAEADSFILRNLSWFGG